MYLIFDTETTGLPVSWKAPVSDVGNWPRVVQLAWEAFDAHRQKSGAWCSLIRPDGFKIPKEAERIHGISTETATRTGVPVKQALEGFSAALKSASVVIAHNFSFDGYVLGAEFYRLGAQNQFSGKIQVCTKEATTEYCALPGPYGYKWPTLSELHFKLFKKNMREAHDAAADTTTCAKCFFELERLGVIRLANKKRR